MNMTVLQSPALKESIAGSVRRDFSEDIEDRTMCHLSIIKLLRYAQTVEHVHGIKAQLGYFVAAACERRRAELEGEL